MSGLKWQDRDMWLAPNRSTITIGEDPATRLFNITEKTTSGDEYRHSVTAEQVDLVLYHCTLIERDGVPIPPTTPRPFKGVVDLRLHVAGEATRAPKGGFSCIYDSGLTPMQEEELFRKKRDEIFAKRESRKE